MSATPDTMTPTTTAASAHPPHDAQGSATASNKHGHVYSQRCACCGSELPEPTRRLVVVGRRRLTCSDGCRRRLQTIVRKIERRQDWIDLWVQERGYRSEREIRAAIKELEQDIRALRGMLAKS